MIRHLFDALPSQRVAALRRKEISTVIRAAGHALIGDKHQILAYIELPRYDVDAGDIADAVEIFESEGEKSELVRGELSVSGVCAEYSFLEPDGPFDDDRVSDALQAYYRSELCSRETQFAIGRPNGSREGRLSDKEMSELLRLYGYNTYKYITQCRHGLMGFSHSLYRTWSSVGFNSVLWTE